MTLIDFGLRWVAQGETQHADCRMQVVERRSEGGVPGCGAELQVRRV